MGATVLVNAPKLGLWARIFNNLLFFPQYHLLSDLGFQNSKKSTESIFLLQRWSTPKFFIPQSGGSITTFAHWAAQQDLCTPIPAWSPAPLAKWGSTAGEKLPDTVLWLQGGFVCLLACKYTGNMVKIREAIFVFLQALWEMGVSHTMFSPFTFPSGDSKQTVGAIDSPG